MTVEKLNDIKCMHLVNKMIGHLLVKHLLTGRNPFVIVYLIKLKTTFE